VQTEDDIRRRRRAFQESLSRGLQRPLAQSPTSSFMPGESAGVPTGIKLGNMSKLPDLRNLGLSLPQPATPNIDLGNIQPPTPNEPATPVTPSPRIGYSTAGLTGTDALIQRRKALEEADPESQVTATGEILPPHKTGRLRGLGQGALLGLGQGDPDRPLYSLGQAIGGAVTGAVSPRSAAKMQRRFDLGQLDTDLAKGLKLENAQADIASTDALRRQRELEPAIQAARIEQQREEANARLELEREKAAGTITQREYDRRQRELDRASREKIAADRITSSEKVAGMRGDGTEARAAKAAAAQQEYDSLITEEEAARVEKERAYKALSDMRQSPSAAKEDIAQAEDAAKTADKNYQSFGEKKRDAQRRIRENQVAAPSSSQPAQPYAGRTMSRANLERYAKDKGLSIEAAQREVEAQGVRVQ
jgi:hypothetical protein